LQLPDVMTPELPQIAFTSIPDLAGFSPHEQPTGLHGPRQCLEDNHALLMPCLYELHPGI